MYTLLKHIGCIKAESHCDVCFLKLMDQLHLKRLCVVKYNQEKFDFSLQYTEINLVYTTRDEQKSGIDGAAHLPVASISGLTLSEIMTNIKQESVC